MGRTGTPVSKNPGGAPGGIEPAKRQDALLSWIEQFAPYGVVTLDETFRVQSWNHWMEAHSRRPFAEVAGKSIFALFPDLKRRKLVSRFELALTGESSVISTALHQYLLPLPTTFREFSGVHMLQTARIAPLYSDGKICGLVLVLEDVTQREGQADALARQHRRDELLSWALAHLLKTEHPRKAVRQLFFKIAEHLDFDTFVIYLRDVETGQMSLDTAGGVPVASEKDFLACPFAALVPPESREIVLLHSVKARREPEYAVLQKAGIAAAVAIPLFSKERDLGLLCFATWSRETIAPEELNLIRIIAQYLATALDRETSRRLLAKAKEELSDHAAHLEDRVMERTARLRETVAELETFSYTVAHDLRAPARAMKGFCEVLLEDYAEGMSDDAKFVVKRIARASRRMETLTDDLLEFSKVSRQEIVLSRVELEPVIEEVLALRSAAVRNATTILTPLPAVLAQRSLLQQVLANLIDNAFKFTRPQTAPNIRIFTETTAGTAPNTRSGPLVFSAQTDAAPGTDCPLRDSLPGQIRIWVQDEGIGIAAEAHEKIFSIFERGTGAELYEGTGMGLAIVARAMERMGGACGVESELGAGSRFWLELPAA